MEKLLEILKSLLSNNNYVTTIGIIVTAVSAYHIAKINATYPGKLKICQKQLESVYLPLNRLLSNLSQEISFEHMSHIQNQLDVILDQNYEYVFPQLHQLNAELHKAINDHDHYKQLLFEIAHQVSVEYELLKRTLGYPSEKILSIFIRMTPQKKFEYILGYLNIVWFPLLFFIIVFKLSDASSVLGNVFSFYFLILIFLNIVYSRLQ